MAGSIQIRVEGLPAMITALERMKPSIHTTARKESILIARRRAQQIRSGPKSLQARRVATTVIALPSTWGEIRVGGPRIVYRHSHAPAAAGLFGSEFGAIKYRQFPPRKKSGYWFFPVIHATAPLTRAEWHDAIGKTAGRIWSDGKGVAG